MRLSSASSAPSSASCARSTTSRPARLGTHAIIERIWHALVATGVGLQLALPAVAA